MTNLQSAETPGGGPRLRRSGGGANANLTAQTQSNPTAVAGEQIGDVGVTNVQNAGTFQDIDLGSRGNGESDADGVNANLTAQSQANPTAVSGDRIDDVGVTNVQSAGSFQDATSAPAVPGVGAPTPT